jgi:hypothetical protein
VDQEVNLTKDFLMSFQIEISLNSLIEIFGILILKSEVKSLEKFRSIFVEVGKKTKQSKEILKFLKVYTLRRWIN